MTCVSFEEKIYNRNLNASGVVAGTLRMRGEELCEASAIKLYAAIEWSQLAPGHGHPEKRSLGHCADRRWTVCGVCIFRFDKIFRLRNMYIVFINN